MSTTLEERAHLRLVPLPPPATLSAPKPISSCRSRFRDKKWAAPYQPRLDAAPLSRAS